jgi:hypothetical protein
MCSSTNFENGGLCISPCLETLKLLSAGNSKFLCELHFVGFFIDFVKTFRRNLGGSKDSCELSAKEMSLLTRERWVRVD